MPGSQEFRSGSLELDRFQQPDRGIASTGAHPRVARDAVTWRDRSTLGDCSGAIIPNSVCETKRRFLAPSRDDHKTEKEQRAIPFVCLELTSVLASNNRRETGRFPGGVGLVSRNTGYLLAIARNVWIKWHSWFLPGSRAENTLGEELDKLDQ